MIPDDEIDRLVGRSTNGANGVKDAYSSGRLPGDLKATASATVDGDASTAWQPGLGTNAQIGSTLTYDLTKPQQVGEINMQVIADGRHSVPTSMTITSGSQTRQVTLPPIADSTVPGAVTTVPVLFAPLTGSHFIVTFTGIRPEYAANYYSAGPLALPLGIAEIGFPGVLSSPTPAQLPGNCVANLMTIDGQPVDVSVVGSTTQALNGGEGQVVPCGPDANGITLAAGTHVVETAVGQQSSVRVHTNHVHRLEHRPARARLGRHGWSGSGGHHHPGGHAPDPGRPARSGSQRHDHVVAHRRPRHRGAGCDATLRAGVRTERQQGVASRGLSRSRGARRLPHAVNLGPPQLVDGFANGWHVTAAELRALGGSSFTVELTWTPQRLVWAALAVSGATLVLCLLLGLLPIRARRWVRARLPRRLRGPAGPDAPERPDRPFDLPALALPFGNPAPPGSAPSADVRWPWWRRIVRAVILGAVTGGVALLVAPPRAGLAVGVIVAVGLLVPRLRAAPTIAGIAFVVAGCLNVVEGQRVHRYLPGSNWAGSFIHAGNLIWLGVVLLVADAVISSFARRVPKPLGRRATRVAASPESSAADGAATSPGALTPGTAAVPSRG